jgi:putative phage-type endonuclease
MIQHSTEWHEARRGKVTASRICGVIKKLKGGDYSTARANYMMELLAERLGGAVAEPFQSHEMRWGSEQEADAFAAYEWRRDADVQPAGFVDHPRLAAGASPDGLVGDDGLIEIKCPNTVQHIETLLSGRPPEKYAAQMMWHMACSGREWCDFVSFDPRLPDAMRLFVRRVHRDAECIAALEEEVAMFLAELDAREAHMRAAYLLPDAEEAAHA